MEEMSRTLLGVVTQSLRGASPAQCPVFNRTIECTQALSEFYLYAQFKSQDDATMSYMQDNLSHFHTFKEVLLLGRAGNLAKTKVNAQRTELVKKRMIDGEFNDDSWMLSKKQCEMNAWRDYISHKIDISKQLDADFNIPKIHLMFHWAEKIR
jgi:hypothetical protein